MEGITESPSGGSLSIVSKRSPGPGANGRPRDDGSRVTVIVSIRTEGLEGGEGGKPELPTVTVGNRDVSGKTVFGPQFSAGAVEVHAGQTGVLSDGLAGSTNEIGTEHAVVPG